MTAPTVADVRAVVLDRLEPELDALGLDPGKVTDDFDLLTSGALDSFGLLELIGDLEARYGLVLDFEDVPDDLTELGTFTRIVSVQAAVNGNGAVEEGESHIEASVTPPTPPLVQRAGAASRVFGRAASGSYRLAVRAGDKIFSLAVAGSFAGFGRRSVIQRPVRLSGERRIALGSGCFVGASSWLQVLARGDGAPVIQIGDNASIAGHCVISAVESVSIGSDVSIARGVYIADHSHEYARGAVLDGRLDGVAPVEIGDGAWLGENVVVLPGVRIGARAVIGANSVVASDVPDRALALGAPARVVRRFA